MNERQLELEIVGLIKQLSAAMGVGYDVQHGSADGADLVVDLDIGGRKPVQLVVEVCADPRLARVQHAAGKARGLAGCSNALAAVAVPRLGPKLKQALRELGIGYLSLDGQVHLRGGGILIDRRLDNLEVIRPEGHGGSLFADKSSLLLRYLLSERSVSLSIREVAAQLGVSAGLASRVSSRLKEDGYLVQVDGLSRLVGRDALLAEWAEFYRRRAKRQREQRFYVHAPNPSSVMRRLADRAGNANLPRWALSFHAGASLVAPYAFFSEVHVLVGGPVSEETVQAFASHFTLEPVRHEANVVLVHPYYQHSWRYGLREIEGLPVVSDVQLYLDLSVYPRRGVEQADRIQQRILALEGAEVVS